MFSIIHCFGSEIDQYSIQHTRAVFGADNSEYIVLCFDNAGSDVSIKDVSVHYITHINACAALNHLIKNAKNEHIIFLYGSVIIRSDILDILKIQTASHKNQIITFNSVGLDKFHGVRKFNHACNQLTFSADLKILRQKPNYPPSIVNPSIFYIRKDMFISCGGFDESFRFGIESLIALSIDIKRYGLGIHFISEIMADVDQDIYKYNLSNRAILADYLGLESLTPEKVETLKIDIKNRKRNIEHYLIPFDEYLKENNPNIISDRELRRRFRNKNIALLYPGCSLEFIEPINLYAFDYVVGIDFVGRIYKCDYVFTQELHILSDLLSVYSSDRVIATDYIFDRLQNRYAYLPDITDKARIIETNSDLEDISGNAPYYLFSDPILCASHLLIAARPKLLQIFGADFNWVNSKSHINNQYYNNGYVRIEDEATKEEYKVILGNLDKLGALARSLNVKVLRNYHV